jgi:FkbH-like protein/non-ribosomal peptide synthase protein (TIGR01720 family)
MTDKTGQSSGASNSPDFVITVTANFTAEPIGDSLRFWMEKLGLKPGRVEFSGFNQVFQELMAVDSALSSATPGVNILFIRLENWARDQKSELRSETITAAVREFIQIFKAFTQRARRSTIVVLCPPSRIICENVQLGKTLHSLAQEVGETIAPFPGVSVINANELAELYPVDVIDDPESDRQGEIPFSARYWAAMGTMAMRKIRTMVQAPHKVIAVDADNTLWGGVVGEAGADQVQVSAEWKVLQEFLRKQKDQGMLLVLVSKNQENDVAEVFRRPDMTLRREDFVAWKVNWTAKSENLRALADELSLGLDSFIFLDDNPVECAEVSARCPGVTVLALPTSQENIPSFLHHVWAFDRPRATSTDKVRTEQYRQQVERKQFQSSATSFAEFISGLNLQVQFGAVGAEQLERASQLTQRTNQFNTTGVRRTTAELAADLSSAGRHQALMVRVKDRFGDYGDVGLCVYKTEQDELRVENFLLSCRVLGKGVEHRMLAALGQAAGDLNLKWVVIPFNRTERNEPAAKFLQAVGAAVREGDVYRFPTAQAKLIAFDPGNVKKAPEVIEEEPREKKASHAVRMDFGDIARNLAKVPDIQAAMRSRSTNSRPNLAGEFVAPRNSVEQTLADIWAEVLGLDRVGIHDNFFDLGGDSIMSIQIISRAHQSDLRFTLKQQFQYPTIAELAPVIETAPQSLEVAEQGVVTGTAPLTPIQQWFFEKNLPEPQHWNMEILLEAQQEISAEVMTRVFEHLVEHHDALRLRFRAEGTGWRQENDREERNVLVQSYDLSSLSASAQDTEMQRLAAISQASLNLEHGPLLRATWFELGENRANRLLIVIHHLAVDGITWRILLEDIRTAYQQLSQDRPVALPRKSHSYLQWATHVREYANGETLRAELPYWRDNSGTGISPIPVDFPEARHQGTEATARVATTTLNARETRSLLTEVPKAYQTQINDVLLTALMETFHNWTGRRSFLIDLEGHGRESIVADLDVSRTAGWFTSIFPVSLHVEQPGDWGSSLKSVKEQLRRIPNRGIGYGLLRYVNEDREVRESLGQLPVAEVMFNYLGQFDQVLPESGLFKLAPENGSGAALHGPKGLRSHLIEIIGRVGDGQLYLEWTYSDKVFEPATIEELARNFGENLRALIKHCLSAEAGGVTPSDFPLSKLGQKGLDQVMAQFAKIRK